MGIESGGLEKNLVVWRSQRIPCDDEDEDRNKEVRALVQQVGMRIKDGRSGRP